MLSMDGQRQDGRMPGWLLYPMKFACQGVKMFKLQLVVIKQVYVNKVKN